MDIQKSELKRDELQQTNPKHLKESADELKTTFPFSHLVFNPQEKVEKLLIHCKQILQAVSFNSKFVGMFGATLEEKVQQLSQSLEQHSNAWKHQKILFIDIDQTLLTRIDSPVEGSQTIVIGKIQIYFKVRPHAIKFLQSMQRYYDLILFSASQDNYSKAFFDYFNRKTNNCLKQYLSRDFCIQAYKNIFFKDLRIIQSHELKDMVLLDNTAFSFGSLIDNGIPILTYDCSQNDRQLEYISSYLIEASKSYDIRQFNRQHLRLRQMVSLFSIK